MIKRLQNRVAESRLTLPLTFLYASVIWLLAGLFLQQSLWLPAGCMTASAYVMLKLNDLNLLIRIYSRTVSAFYIVLVCAAPFLLASLPGAFIQLCAIMALTLLSISYKDKRATGWTFYAFSCLSLGSTAEISLLYYVPLLWFIMAWYTYSLSWRTFLASLLGLLTPYWFLLAWHWTVSGGSLEPWMSHLAGVASLRLPIDYTVISTQRMIFFTLVIACYLTGSIHFLNKKSDDKIRVRQIYYSLITATGYSCILTALQPNLYDMTIRMMMITVSPIIAHFITLTHTKWTNMVFIVLSAIIITITIFNLWMLSSAS